MEPTKLRSGCPCPTCQANPTSAEAEEHTQMRRFAQTLNEQQRRLFAGLEANRRGYGGQKTAAEILELSVPTVSRGQRELASGEIVPGVRRPGGGRLTAEKKSRTPQRVGVPAAR
jgi:hypothetical protein